MLQWCRIDTGPPPPKSRRPSTQGGRRCGKYPRFVVEQPLLDRQPAAEAGQGTVGADDTMAGEYDAHWIRSIGGADGSGRGRDAESGRLASVGRGGPEWNLRQRAPGRDLETRALEVEWDVERAPLAGEVLVELPGRGLQDRMVRIAMGTPADSRAFARRLRPDDGPQSTVGRHKRKGAHRGRMGGGVEHRLVVHH